MDIYIQMGPGFLHRAKEAFILVENHEYNIIGNPTPRAMDNYIYIYNYIYMYNTNRNIIMKFIIDTKSQNDEIKCRVCKCPHVQFYISFLKNKNYICIQCYKHKYAESKRLKNKCLSLNHKILKENDPKKYLILKMYWTDKHRKCNKNNTQLIFNIDALQQILGLHQIDDVDVHNIKYIKLPKNEDIKDVSKYKIIWFKNK